MSRIKLKISYDGTNFCGWQKQKDHKHGPDAPSIQETLERTLSKIFDEPIRLNASGRTDSGVHALAQICDFKTDAKIPKDLCWATRSTLPSSISVREAWLAPDEFHSTLSATHKTYRYWVWNEARPSALLDRFSSWVRKPLDLDFLNEAAGFIQGKHDFKSFQTSGTEVKSTERQIYRATWVRRQSGLVEFRVTGNGFLKQMVRNLVGTQLDLFLKDRQPSEMKAILAALSRQAAGTTAPPQGLFLAQVYYPKDLDNKCRQI